ncbi:hypothetical protein WAB17_07595 [Parerythrobacter aurantius]|uniref:hypothetical protein n=1 Tax=Parerythrobacter aurantius TaxID=3127706 RepID=UPI00324A7E78
MKKNTSSSQLQDHLHQQYGPLIGNSDLARALGFQNTAAMRQAKRRGQLQIETFRIPNRRGLFAFTSEVSKWLITTANGGASMHPSTPKRDKGNFNA